MTLVFARKSDQAIYIGDTIRVRVGYRWNYNSVRLVIEAPPSVPVLRAEIRNASIPAKQIDARKDFTRLVLTRRKDDSIFIGDDVRITIVDIRGDRVRIGVDAPRSVAVHREEVYEAIKAENNPVAKAVANVNSVINARTIAVPKIAARKEVVSMT